MGVGYHFGYEICNKFCKFCVLTYVEAWYLIWLYTVKPRPEAHNYGHDPF